MTLLVLDIKVPKAAEVAPPLSLAMALLRQWPVYAAYVLSFGTVPIMWINESPQDVPADPALQSCLSDD